MNENEPIPTLANKELLSITRYLEILLKSPSILSRQKSTSHDAPVQFGKGLIDKLEIYLPTTLLLTDTISKCNELGLKYRDKYLLTRGIVFVLLGFVLEAISHIKKNNKLRHMVFHQHSNKYDNFIVK